MDAQLECFPCFLRQAISMCREVRPGETDLHARVLTAWAAKFSELDLNDPPPAWAGTLYPIASEILGVEDPFARHKQEANDRILELLPALEELVSRTDDPLKAALHLCIVGNYIDCGVDHEFDWENALFNEKDAQIEEKPFRRFADRINGGCKMVILGDNAGEIGLDTLLVKELSLRGCDVTYAVRGVPVLNDATISDAKLVGMTDLCRVVTSGVRSPGTVLSQCTPEFLEELHGADLILSKGQGNFEALQGRLRRTFFAFKAKCRVISKLTGKPLGTSLFIHQE